MTHNHFHDHARRRADAEARRRTPRRPGFDSGFSGGPGFGAELFGPGNPFGPRRGGRARRGDIRAAILSVLADGPNSGYGVITQIQERSDGAWRPSPGSVYPTLQQLVDEELVEHLATDGRSHEYALTEAGTTWVADHVEELARVWESTSHHRGASPEAGAFHEAAAKFHRALGQFAREATPEQQKIATARLDELRKTLYGMLAE